MGNIHQDSILMTADVVGLYARIPHDVGLEAIKDALNSRKNKKIPTDMLVQTAKFVLTSNCFEFQENVFHQISGYAIDTKFTPPYARTFKDKFETDLFKTPKFQAIV